MAKSASREEHKIDLPGKAEILLSWNCHSLVTAQNVLMSQLQRSLEIIWSEFLLTDGGTEAQLGEREKPKARELESEHSWRLQVFLVLVLFPLNPDLQF